MRFAWPVGLDPYLNKHKVNRFLVSFRTEESIVKWVQISIYASSRAPTVVVDGDSATYTQHTIVGALELCISINVDRFIRFRVHANMLATRVDRQVRVIQYKPVIFSLLFETAAK